MMEIYIFDMDGVLIKPMGYHRALKETVHLAGKSIGFDDASLTDHHIAQFEALGISSEWHSSALCFAIMSLKKQVSEIHGTDNSKYVLEDRDLQGLFSALEIFPMKQPVLQRARLALDNLIKNVGISSEHITNILKNCESIENSLTMNVFEELILGSDFYERSYQKKAQFQVDSYLTMYDEPLLSNELANRITLWASKHNHGIAMMTARPSKGLSNKVNALDAELGAALVGMENVPIIGYGEMAWLAERSGKEVSAFMKPSKHHALASVMSAAGWQKREALKYCGKQPDEWRPIDLNLLQDSRITVFEDTPGGMMSVQELVNYLKSIGIHSKIRKIGIAMDENKLSALVAQNAVVYPTINDALEDLTDFD